MNLSHKYNFQSLTSLGIDWVTLIRDNPELTNKYSEFLSLQSDWIVVNIDYSQIELYALASVSRDPGMIKAVNAGLDIHKVNTEKMYSCSYDKIEAEFERVKLSSKELVEYKRAKAELDLFKSRRKSIKALTFSLSYGAGSYKIAMDQRISEEEAKKLINDFYSLYPEIRKWQQRTFLGAVQNGYIETPFGRRRGTPKVHNRMDAYRALALENAKDIKALQKSREYWTLRNELKTCMNTPVQSVASDMCSWAAYKTKEYFKTLDGAAQFLFWIHDSLVFAVHIDSAVEVINKVTSIMENDVKYDGDPVNYRTSIEVGRNYEFCVEISSKEKENLTKESILEKIEESILLDTNKKFKLIVKETSLDLEDRNTYLNTVKHDKMDQFKEMIDKLGISGISTPMEYMSFMNKISVEEYEEMELIGEDSEENNE